MFGQMSIRLFILLLLQDQILVLVRLMSFIWAGFIVPVTIVAILIAVVIGNSLDVIRLFVSVMMVPVAMFSGWISTSFRSFFWLI